MGHVREECLCKKRSNRCVIILVWEHMITPSRGIEHLVTLVGGECSHHCAIPAPQETADKGQITTKTIKRIQSLHFKLKRLVCKGIFLPNLTSFFLTCKKA